MSDTTAAHNCDGWDSCPNPAHRASDTTAEGLTDLRELVHAATGPWGYLSTTGEVECAYTNSTLNSTLTIESTDGESAGTIASGVVAAVNLLPALLDRLGALQETVARLNRRAQTAEAAVNELATGTGKGKARAVSAEMWARCQAVHERGCRRAESAEAERDAARAEVEALRERVGALADDWAEAGPSLVRNAYDGSNVTEEQTLERCAAAVRAALGADR